MEKGSVFKLLSNTASSQEKKKKQSRRESHGVGIEEIRTEAAPKGQSVSTSDALCTARWGVDKERDHSRGNVKTSLQTPQKYKPSKKGDRMISEGEGRPTQEKAK